MSVTLNLTSANAKIVSTVLPLSNSFTDSLAALNCGVVTDYQFGTGASGSAPVVPIRNITDLATYFNPSPDAVGTAVQNIEVERFASSFNTTNHVFGTSDLELTAILEASAAGTFDIITKNLVGAITTSNVLVFADTTGIQPGMMIASTQSQASAPINTGKFVLSVDSSTQITLNSFGPITLPNAAPVQFLPCYPVTCNAITNGTLLVVPSGVPSALQVGAFYNNVTNGTFGIRRIQSFPDSTHIQLDGTVTVTAGNLVFFSPPVVSAQIWSKAGYQPGASGAGINTGATNCNVVAMELTCTIPATASQGAWPAWWQYSRTSEGNTFDASEIDMFEFFYGTTSGSNAFTSNIHGGIYNDFGADYKITVGSSVNHWDASGFLRLGIDYSLAQHKFQIIWTRDRVYRFIDGVLMVVNKYMWSSKCTGQIGLDLSAGSFLTAFLATNFYPQTTAQFPFAYKVNELKIWQA